MVRNQKGQEILEVALVGGLVFVAALGVTTLFGEKISGFFNNNAATVLANHSTPVISANDFNTYKDHSLLVSGSAGTTGSIDNEKTGETVNIDGRDYVFNSAVMDQLDAIKEVAGSSGVEDILAEIAYLTKNNPEAEVEIDFGKSTGLNSYVSKGEESRNFIGWGLDDKINVTATYSGNDSISQEVEVETNTVVVKVGNKAIILDREVKCSAEGNACDNYPADRYYRIEGSIDENNNFKGKVTSNNDKYVFDSVYETKIDEEKGLVFDSAKIYDPLIENIKTHLSEHNTLFRSVVGDLNDGKDKDYLISEKRTIKELVLKLRNKYKGQVDVVVDKRGWILGLFNEALLVGLVDQTKSIEFEEKNKSVITPVTNTQTAMVEEAEEELDEIVEESIEEEAKENLEVAGGGSTTPAALEER